MATSSTRLSASGRILGVDQIHVEERTLRTQLQKAWAVLKDMGYELWKSKLATWGAAFVLLMCLVAVFADVIDRYDPLDMASDALLSPGWEHWFGTDPYGRDIWSRVVHGARRAMAISSASVCLGVILGVPLGAVSGYFGMFIMHLCKLRLSLPLDNIIMRLVDAWLAMPGLLFFLLIVSVFGGSDLVLVIALGVAQVPLLARLVRGSVLAEKVKEYVEASHIVGDSNFSIIFRQILPNCLSPIIVQASISIGFLVIVEAALSFLGLGAQPPTPAWGSDLNEAKNFMETYPLLTIFPGVALSLTVLGFNLFGDGLRDILDPRQVEQ
jgi:peptide/nickel transport system permease protein